MRYITDVIHYFNPRSPHGERRKTAVKAMEKAFISIHAPRTGSDYIWQCGLYVGGISIHAPRTGSDTFSPPTSPISSISIHAPRTGSDSCDAYFFAPHVISIHAPRTGSDREQFFPVVPTKHFNPRSPHGERPRAKAVAITSAIFQSTLPARGATSARRVPGNSCAFQSTLPARGATRRIAELEADTQFQSTLPARGATASWLSASAHYGISIHAPRTGSDDTVPHKATKTSEFQSTLPARGATGLMNPDGTIARNFNPRSPHGERPPAASLLRLLVDFNPRSPHGERPGLQVSRHRRCDISIHAPRTGSDKLFRATRFSRCNFNPRSPHGERPR